MKKSKQNYLTISILSASIIISISIIYLGFSYRLASPIPTAMAAEFEKLSKTGNSSCSGSFTQSIASMDDTHRLRGSCCSPMDFHRYQEQIEGLKKYGNNPKIPSNPYDISAGLAKELTGYYETIILTAEEQEAYDYATKHSHEKGPCCCKCWRWHVYGGLGKFLIRNYGFTGEQLTEIWNLSDGCGGSGDHVTH